MFQMDYEPLDGSMISTDTQRRIRGRWPKCFKETVILEMKSYFNGVDNENEPISTSTPKKPTKTQQQLTCKKAGCSYQTSVSGNLKRHAKAQTAMDFQPYLLNT